MTWTDIDRAYSKVAHSVDQITVEDISGLMVNLPESCDDFGDCKKGIQILDSFNHHLALSPEDTAKNLLATNKARETVLRQRQAEFETKLRENADTIDRKKCFYMFSGVGGIMTGIGAIETIGFPKKLKGGLITAGMAGITIGLFYYAYSMPSFSDLYAQQQKLDPTEAWIDDRTSSGSTIGLY